MNPFVAVIAPGMMGAAVGKRLADHGVVPLLDQLLEELERLGLVLVQRVALRHAAPADHLPQVRNYNVAVAEEGDRVVFLHHIVPGGADRSYGIHVAQLAGLPKPVIRRAEELLEELEQGQHDHATRSNLEEAPLQLSLFGGKNPVLEELEDLDVNALSPLEALNKLFEWKKQIR